ncbi:copper transporter family protein [Sporothrix schenckii 1099-18]|nr:copper transporter family protein [Sporothrix schenckii 1099-18]KJR88155.1 copper transporter family protein [Sporothrix schenckii 1099-18]
MTSTTTMAMASATPTAMPMSMSGSSSDLMGMSMMSMTFFYSLVTPLYSTAWTPATTGQYAGTCIFLIVLTVIYRALVAFRAAIFARTHLPGHASAVDVEKEKASLRRFNAGRELVRGVVEAITGGISYLLMIAVMTMNVGYFASVIAGLFLGGFLVGRFDDAPAHC